MTTPLIFVSTVSAEYKSMRQRIANVLTRLGYQPVWQDIFGTEPGDLRQMLRDKIDECEGLIHVVGDAYGAEPPTVETGLGRVSYTQFEFLYARQRGKKTWLLFPGAACTRDSPLEKLDLPRDAAHVDPVGFQAERRRLQAAYKENLRQSGHLWHEPANDTDLELKVERLRDEAAVLRQGFRLWQSDVLEGIQRVAEGQKVTAARIRDQLIEASEARLKEDLVQAEKLEQWEKREAAQRAHAARLARIDELAASFAQIESREEGTTVFKEMTRILAAEGVDAALAYLAHKRGDILQQIRKRASAMHEQNRADLLPLLKGAGLYVAQGKVEIARTNFQQMLELEPDWGEALQNFADFLIDESVRSEFHGTLGSAITDARRALEIAQRMQRLDSANGNVQRRLSVALSQMANVLIKRGQPGDADLALTNYTRSLAIDKGLFEANPELTDAARNLCVAFINLGDFLADRGRPGDAALALSNYSRGLEISERLLKANPNSTQAARDVSVGFGRLGSFLDKRALPGDTELALTNFNRSVEIDERLFKANPDSPEAMRDLSVSLDRLGNFLALRGLPGDAESALTNYTRSLEISERLLKANPDSVQAARDFAVCLARVGNSLANRGLPGDAELALTNYTRSLEISEQRFRKDPDSTQAARDLSLDLGRLGDLLFKRGLPGDAELALTNYTRSVEIEERIFKANPESDRTIRDLSVSLMRLGEFHARRGLPTDNALALTNYTRSLELRKRLFEANPDSPEAAVNVVSLLFMTEQLAEKNKDEVLAERHRRASYELLRSRIAAGMQFEEPMKQLYSLLKQTYDP